MVSYKPHYACFNCRKTFKRRLFYDIRKGVQNDIAKCPQCGKPMTDMGLDFASPSKNDKKSVGASPKTLSSRDYFPFLRLFGAWIYPTGQRCTTCLF